MLKILHGTIDAKKEPLFLSVYGWVNDNRSFYLYPYPFRVF